MKCFFSFSIGNLVPILTGALVAAKVYAEIGDHFLGTELDYKLAGTLSLGKPWTTCVFVAIIGTIEIGVCVTIYQCVRYVQIMRWWCSNLGQ